MGVDIYGRNPQITSERPEINYETASEGDKECYWDILYEWEEENPGYYFRSNWWGWRPIVAIADAACFKADLNIDTSGWHSNDGEGPESQEECNQIADAIEAMIFSPKSPLKDDTDKLYICMGAWCNANGGFLSEGVSDELNDQYPQGFVLTASVLTKSGELAYPAHGVSLLRIKEFITFLRNCGGFQVF